MGCCWRVVVGGLMLVGRCGWVDVSELLLVG